MSPLNSHILCEGFHPKRGDKPVDFKPLPRKWRAMQQTTRVLLQKCWRLSGAGWRSGCCCLWKSAWGLSRKPQPAHEHSFTQVSPGGKSSACFDCQMNTDTHKAILVFRIKPIFFGGVAFLLWLQSEWLLLTEKTFCDKNVNVLKFTFEVFQILAFYFSFHCIFGANCFLLTDFCSCLKLNLCL